MKKILFITICLLTIPHLSFALEDLRSGLVGYWPLDFRDTLWKDSNTATTFDRAGNNNIGTFTNQVITSQVIGKIGQAYNFDGSNDQIALTNNSSTLSPTGAVTVSAWISYNSARVYDLLAGNTDGGSNGYRFWYNVADASAQSNSLIFSINAYATGEAAVAFTADKKWHHVVGTYDGANTNIYLDGVKGNGGTVSGNITYTGATPLIGARLAGGWTAWNGYIDDVHIYNRALSATEVKQLYRDGEGVDSGTFIDSVMGAIGGLF